MKQQTPRFCVAKSNKSSDAIRYASILIVLCTALNVVVPALAQRPHPVQCLSDNDILEQDRVVIPVGCALVDCCPGCPGNVINWRINVSGDPVESVVLQFENLSAKAKRGLTIKGNARWEGNSLRVGKGETVVSGFKHDPRSAPPVATPRVFADQEAVRRIRQTAVRADRATRGLARAEIFVEQLMGAYRVNEASLAYDVMEIPPETPNTDHIELFENVMADRAIVLLDGRDGNGNCVNDMAYRGHHIVQLGNVLSKGNCNSDVAIFSDDNQMYYVSPVDTWTDTIPEKLSATLPRLLMAPVSVWISNRTSGTQELAEWHMANAAYLFNSNNAGIGFNATYTDVSANANARTTIGTGCATVNAIKNSSFFTADRVNVYYVDRAFTGVTYCGGELNVIYIGTTANTQTLAHEFGHSFSLDHTNGLTAFCGNNIMQGGGSGRTHFSVGQSFRMNVDEISSLNVNRVRNGRVRSCTDTTINQLCPALALDVTPK